MGTGALEVLACIMAASRPSRQVLVFKKESEADSQWPPGIAP